MSLFTITFDTDSSSYEAEEIVHRPKPSPPPKGTANASRRPVTKTYSPPPSTGITTKTTTRTVDVSDPNKIFAFSNLSRNNVSNKKNNKSDDDDDENQISFAAQNKSISKSKSNFNGNINYNISPKTREKGRKSMKSDDEGKDELDFRANRGRQQAENKREQIEEENTEDEIEVPKESSGKMPIQMPIQMPKSPKPKKKIEFDEKEDLPGELILPINSENNTQQNRQFNFLIEPPPPTPPKVSKIHNPIINMNNNNNTNLDNQNNLNDCTVLNNDNVCVEIHPFRFEILPIITYVVQRRVKTTIFGRTVNYFFSNKNGEKIYESRNDKGAQCTYLICDASTKSAAGAIICSPDFDMFSLRIDNQYGNEIMSVRTHHNKKKHSSATYSSLAKNKKKNINNNDNFNTNNNNNNNNVNNNINNNNNNNNNNINNNIIDNNNNMVISKFPDISNRKFRVYFFSAANKHPDRLQNCENCGMVPDFGDRAVLESTKNFILVDETLREFIAIRKISKNVLEVDSQPYLPGLCIFGVGLVAFAYHNIFH